jgi:hypothetical protein
MSNFFSVPSVFHQFFACIALDDVDLHFPLMLVRTAILLKGKLYDLCDYVTSVISPYTWLIVMSLSASLQHKKSAAVDFLCQITLNKKLSHIANAISLKPKIIA